VLALNPGIVERIVRDVAEVQHTQRPPMLLLKTPMPIDALRLRP
jgi:hypothetical protein